MKELTHKQSASNGGKKRWANYTADQRKKEMQKVWSKRKKGSVKHPKKFSTVLSK